MTAQPLEGRVARLEGIVEQVNERLGSLERAVSLGFSNVDSRFTQVESRFDRLESRFDVRLALIDQRFNWLIGIVVATWITTMLAIFFHR